MEQKKDFTFANDLDALEAIEKVLHGDIPRLNLRLKVAAGAIIKQAKNIENGELENYTIEQLREKRDKLTKHITEIDKDHEFYKELTLESSNYDYKQFYMISGNIFNRLHFEIEKREVA